MVKKRWVTPTLTSQQVDPDKLGDVEKLSEAELKIRLEEAGYQFQKKTYRTNPNYMIREIAGESVLVSMGEGVADFRGVIMLNESAKVLWEAMKHGATKEELVNSLKQHFQITEEKALEDVEKSLSLLQERRMVSCE